MKVRCPKCGAEFEAEGGVVTCPYCGFQIRFGESRTFTYPLRVEDPWKPLVSFIRLQRLSPNDVEWKGQLVERELLYVPFYVFFVNARGMARASSDGLVNVEFFNYITVPAAEGFDELISYPLPTRGRRYFDGRVEGRLVEKTLSEDEARERLRETVQDLLGKEVRRHFRWGRFVVDVPDLDVTPDGLVYYPVWRVRYRYGLLTYRAYVDGADGRIPYVEFPIALPKRFVNFTLGSLLLSFGFLAGKLLLPHGFTSLVGSMGAAVAASAPSLRRAFTLRERASEHRLLSEIASEYAPGEEALDAIRRFWRTNL